MGSINEINLSNIAGGVTTELFNHELEKVAKNIADINTKAKFKRKIVLTFEFSPDDEREEVMLSVKSKITLAPIKECTKTIYCGSRNGKAILLEQDVGQTQMFDENVAQIRKDDAIN